MLCLCDPWVQTENFVFLLTKNDSISFYCWCVVLNFTQIKRLESSPTFPWRPWTQHWPSGPFTHVSKPTIQHFNDMQLWEVLHVCSVEILLNSRQLVVDVFKHPNTMHFWYRHPFQKALATWCSFSVRFCIT